MGMDNGNLRIAFFLIRNSYPRERSERAFVRSSWMDFLDKPSCFGLEIFPYSALGIHATSERYPF